MTTHTPAPGQQEMSMKGDAETIIKLAQEQRGDEFATVQASLAAGVAKAYLRMVPLAEPVWPTPDDTHYDGMGTPSIKSSDVLLPVLTEARNWIQYARNDLFLAHTDGNGRFNNDTDAESFAAIDELLARINAAIEGAA